MTEYWVKQSVTAMPSTHSSPHATQNPISPDLRLAGGRRSKMDARFRYTIGHRTD